MPNFGDFKRANDRKPQILGCVAHDDDAAEYPLYCNNCHHAPTNSDQCRAYRMKEIMVPFGCV